MRYSEEFMEVMKIEGSDHEDAAKRYEYLAAIAYGRHLGRPYRGYTVTELNAGTLVIDERPRLEWDWEWFPDLAADEAVDLFEKIHQAERESLRREPEPPIVGSIVARFQVAADGSIYVTLADGHGYNAPMLAWEINYASREVQSYRPAKPKTDDEARALVRALWVLFQSDVNPLLRDARGGRRSYRKKVGGRVQHGLSSEQLIEFAERCDALEPTKGAKEARALVSTEMGIPKEYGGAARAAALWRLHKWGRELRDAKTQPTRPQRALRKKRTSAGPTLVKVRLRNGKPPINQIGLYSLPPHSGDDPEIEVPSRVATELVRSWPESYELADEP